MNFLAHLHIADATNTCLAGAMAGDFVKGSLPASLTAFQLGVALHRKVDSFIDSHPELISLSRQFPKHYRRTAGILLDMAFDHQLARHWHQWHSLPLQTFNQQSYREVLATPELPPRASMVIANMAEGDWLSGYASREGLTTAIQGVSRRLSKPELLAGGELVLFEMEALIQQSFTQLYPQILAFAQQQTYELAQRCNQGESFIRTVIRK